MQQGTKSSSTEDGKVGRDLTRSSFSVVTFVLQHPESVWKKWKKVMLPQVLLCFCLVTAYHSPTPPCKLVYLMQWQPLLQKYEPVVFHGKHYG